MSCCGKDEVRLLKEYRHARVLCRMAANLTQKKYVIFIENSQWGQYYKFMDHEKAEELGKEIIQFYIPGGKAKKTPKGVAAFLE